MFPLRADPLPLSYPAGRVAVWQLLASAAVAAGGGWWAGWHGAVSGFLGGIVNVLASVVFAMLVRLGRPETAAGTLRTMLRAEAAKIAVIVLQLSLVLTTYREVVHGAFFAAFVVTVFVSQAAILIRD
ncbi:MAG TPA: ATP synthase subunit I [Casimicrobiaceae bacterium]|nr:ATP synthase subunit I [Casimicrobiaceae bacterium]